MRHPRLQIRGTLVLSLLGACGCTGRVSLPSGFEPSSSGHAGGSEPGGGGSSSVPGPTGGGGQSPPGSFPGGPTGGPLDAQRVTLRRLNRAEYDNTVRDLLGTMTKPSVKFPGDPIVDGFDTVGEVLSFSQLLAEQIESASDTLVTELVARPKGDPLRARILVCEPAVANFATCLPQILSGFMKSAYRRPVDPAEVQDIAELGTSVQKSSGDPIRGLQAALKTVLLSPHFLFHVELGNPSSKEAAPLNDHEVASRLSYFLWSSMPDAELTAAAESSLLTRSPADVAKQVARMLDDAKAQALVDNFAGQWLSIRDVDGVSPDPQVFPKFDESLLRSIAEETRRFFQSLLADNASLDTLLLANYTYANGRLSQHYGLGAPATQTTYGRTILGPDRMGILTQETFLTTSSQPDRTSPVRRGNWVLERILCDPPPAPPPGIPPLETPALGSGITVRNILAMHRQSPQCAGCHNSIDPVGLGFENYDAVGAYRMNDNGVAIESKGTLPPDPKHPTGATYQSPLELILLLASDARFPRCVVKQAMTYAVGRSFEAEDANAYITSVAAPLTGKSTFQDLFRVIATSQAFMTRRGEAP